jgi:hypothetical protein
MGFLARLDTRAHDPIMAAWELHDVASFDVPGPVEPQREKPDQLPVRQRFGSVTTYRLHDTTGDDLGLFEPGAERRRGRPCQVGITDSAGRAVVIGSAWRCTIFQPSSSRRRIVVQRSDTGVSSSLPPTFAW